LLQFAGIDLWNTPGDYVTEVEVELQDPRRSALLDWLATQGWRFSAVEVASADASFRR